MEPQRIQAIVFRCCYANSLPDHYNDIIGTHMIRRSREVVHPYDLGARSPPLLLSFSLPGLIHSSGLLLSCLGSGAWDEVGFTGCTSRKVFVELLFSAVTIWPGLCDPGSSW